MTKQKLDLVSGELVFWSCSRVDKDQLNKGFEQAGIPTYVRAVSVEIALDEAVGDRYRRQPGVLIRKAAISPNGWPRVAVVAETVSSDGNQYADKAAQTLLEIDPADWSVYEVQSGTKWCDIDAACYIGKVLGRAANHAIKLAIQKIGGLRIRDNGGVWFASPSVLPRLNDLTTAMAANQVPVTFGRVVCRADESTASAIADAAADDLRERYEEILTKLSAVESEAANDLSGKRQSKLADKRKELMTALDGIKNAARDIDNGFQGLTALTSQISNEIDSQIALAVLATSN